MNCVLVAIPCWSKKETGNPFEAVGFRFMDPRIKFMNSTTTDGYSYIKESHIKNTIITVGIYTIITQTRERT